MSNAIEEVRAQIIKYTEIIISYGLPILYFLIALGFYLKTYDSAQIKITFTQLGGTIVLAIWIIKIIEEDILSFFKKNILIIFPLLAYLVSGIISHLHSAFPLASANELIRRVIYMGIAVLAVSEFNSEEKLRRLINWLIGATFIVTIYGLVQYFDTRFFPGAPEPGLDPFMWRGAFGGRIFSTFGNPNFFGDFLVVMNPVVLAMLLMKKQLHLLVLWLLVAFCVIFTFSKGAWLGFSAGIVIFAFFYVGFFSHANKEKIKKILAVMILGLFVVLGYGMRKSLKQRSDSASFRVFTWLSTWEMMKTSPIIGTGIGTFYVTYPAWRRPQIFFIEAKHNTETDHSENEYIEVWYDEGTVGFGIFLLLLAAFLTMGFKNLKIFSLVDKRQPTHDVRAYYQLGILTAVMAQLVHDFTCVSLRFVSSGVMLWLFIGLIGALALNSPLPEKAETNLDKNPLPEFPRRILQVGVVLIAAYLCWIFIGYFRADLNHNKAIFYSKQGQWNEALNTYREVAKDNPSFIMAYYFMGNVYNDRWANGDAENAINEYKKAWKLAPNYVQSHHQAGLIYLKWGQDENRLEYEARQKGNLKSAEEHKKKKEEVWKKALDEFERYRLIDPVFNLNYYRMAWIYMQLGEKNKAENAYKMHIDFPSKLKLPPHNAWVEDWASRRKNEYAETYINLGNLRFLDNDFNQAEKYYKQAIDLVPDYVSAMKNLALLYAKTNRKKLAEEYWQKIRVISPNDPDVLKVFGIKK
ncbi:MAG: O-antigen ligase family protein [Elusimicrobia bacterium]|nr:O-antigen ligase family protein [Elusimicrobiota bacterium]